MPPIPEGACIIADYMLMADFVRMANPSSSSDIDKISKGVRRVSPTRDIFYEDVSGFIFSLDLGAGGFYVASNTTASANASSNKGADLRYNLSVSLSDAYSGTKKTIKLRTPS